MLIQGDCLEVMRTMEAESVDIAITSPPYNTLPQTNKPSGLHAERKTGVNKWIEKSCGGYDFYSDNADEGEYQAWITNVVKELIRICRGIVWINHKVRYRDGLAIHPLSFLPFPIYSEIIWDRGVSMALNCKRYSPSHEVIYGIGKPNYWNDANNKLMSVWRIPPQRSSEHPCPFPVEIPSRLIQSSCPPGGKVIDCFAGVGTTGVAAQRLGREFIGIELNPEYVKMAQKRIADDMPLFADALETGEEE